MARELIRDIMTPNVVKLSMNDTVIEAARKMRDHNIGDVLVMDGQEVTGIITDRDIVVRVIAAGKDVNSTKLNEACTQTVITLTPDENVEKAIDLMKKHAIRRLPITEQGRPVGIVALGDLAEQRDPKSTLGEISDAPPNH